MEDHETTGNVILVKVGCEVCPSNSLTMLTRKELENAESEVGKKRVCPNCQTVWRLDALDIRFKVTPDSLTVVTALPLWTPRLTKETPARQMHALPDAFDNYDEESVANAVEEYASELARRAATAPAESKEPNDMPPAEPPVHKDMSSPSNSTVHSRPRQRRTTRGRLGTVEG